MQDVFVRSLAAAAGSLSSMLTGLLLHCSLASLCFLRYWKESCVGELESRAFWTWRVQASPDACLDVVRH